MQVREARTAVKTWRGSDIREPPEREQGRLSRLNQRPRPSLRVMGGLSRAWVTAEYLKNYPTLKHYLLFSKITNKIKICSFWVFIISLQ